MGLSLQSIDKIVGRDPHLKEIKPVMPSIYIVKIGASRFDPMPSAFSLTGGLVVSLFNRLFYQALQTVGRGETQ